MLYILTLNYNGKHHLEKLYPSINKSIPMKWLIKDNGSTDDSVSYIKSLNDPLVSIVETKHNRDNFSKGCNVLFNMCEAQDEDHILLLNNDIIFNDNHSLKNMIHIMENDPSVGVVGAKLLYTDNTLQHAGVVMGARTNFCPIHLKANQPEDKASTKNREFQALTGACLLTKAKYYKQICKTNPSRINGLDESYIWCFEDIDACLSIKYDMGKKIVYCGTTKIYHEESATLKKVPSNKLFLNKNMNTFVKKWRNKVVDDIKLYNNPNYNLYTK